MAKVSRLPRQEEQVPERSSASLRETLFETLEGLRDESIEPSRAREVCRTAAQIISSVKMEIEFHKYVRLHEQDGLTQNTVLRLT